MNQWISGSIYRFPDLAQPECIETFRLCAARRLAEKAENVNAKKGGYTDSYGTERVAGTPMGSTPLGGSKNVSQEDIAMSIAKLNLVTDRDGSSHSVVNSRSRSSPGLLGENGSGKSTFLQSIAECDIEIPEHIDISIVRGEADPSEINAVDANITSARLIKELSVQEDVDEIAMDTSYEQLDELDPATFEAKAASILYGLGYSQEMMARPTKDMSGGWRIPYLSTYNHILVITSHSRDFMDTVCTHIMDLIHKKKLVYYSGNYSTYVKTKTENETNQMFIASAGTYVNLVRQAKSKQKIIDKMEAAGLIEKIETPKPLNFQFEDISELPPPIIAFDDVAFSYSGQKKDYFMDSRIAILGANGIEKSTLLHLITGALQPCEGMSFPFRTVSKHVNLKLAKYSQHSADQLPYESSPIEYFQSLFSEKYPDKDMQFWRARLGRFGLSGAHQTSPIKQLDFEGHPHRLSSRRRYPPFLLQLLSFLLLQDSAEEVWC
ncbi:hypothetical protein BKA70DRAFT_1493948 [Coprinopsis sp. MPI-PUGE-AT-0042]|nr:hypothetical protein BKA70DRAFT_1493948 [Coprinopsis sp. MPI-PUGE-AT-0042]